MSNKFLADFYQQLNPDNTMTFNRLLAHSIGAVETIIFFTLVGKFYYYSDREMLEEDGWFYVTVPDLHESTSFGEKVQRNAIKHLENIGFIQTALKGVPAKRYFKVNNDMELLQEYLVKGKEISDGILIKAAENTAKKIALRHKKAVINPIESQFLPNGGTSSDNNFNDFCDDDNNYEKTEEMPEKLSSAQTAELAPPKRRNLSLPNGGTSSSQMAELTYKSKSNKSKSNKSINQDTYSCDDLGLIDEMRKLIMQNIDYEYFVQDYENPKHRISGSKDELDELVEIMTECVCSKSPTIRIGKQDIPQELVKSRYLKLTHENIEYVFDSLALNTTKIKNMKAYLMTTLYNAPVTMINHISADVRHDMLGFARADPVNQPELPFEK